MSTPRFDEMMAANNEARAHYGPTRAGWTASRCP